VYVDLNSERWRDLIFEGRNQEYGAYYLRKTSTKRHLLALCIVMAVTAVVILLLTLSNFLHFNPAQSADEYEPKPIELSELIWLEENRNQNQVKTEKIPDLKEIVKFSPPTIVEDENMVEELQELQETNFLADSIDILGEDTLLLQLQQKMAQANPEAEEEQDATTTNGKFKPAEFQDGKTALLRYIYQNIKYPPAALKQRINGRVIYSFIINEDGSISDITLVQGIYIFLDEEVLRVIRSMPAWKPAMKDGKAVKVKYVMPVVFRL
jgi:protein TonB